MALHEDIDKRHPPSPIPFDAPTTKVGSVTDAGVIHLTDGRQVVMDGVSCSAQAAEYLRRMLIDARTTVAVNPHSTGTPIAAEVWAVSTFEDMDGKSYSAIAETALTSGWCAPQLTNTNPHNDRYEALMKEFGAQREAEAKLRANKALQPTPSRCALGRG
jgi:hypothetical protein